MKTAFEGGKRSPIDDSANFQKDAGFCEEMASRAEEEALAEVKIDAIDLKISASFAGDLRGNVVSTAT